MIRIAQRIILQEVIGAFVNVGRPGWQEDDTRTCRILHRCNVRVYLDIYPFRGKIKMVASA